MARRTTRTFRKRTGRAKLDSENAIRKVSIVAKDGSDWNMLGYEYEDPETGETICEGDGDEPIPVFQGIGISARPVGVNGEALMLHVGNQADHPILATVRDEDGRLAYVDEFGELSAGEIAIYNGQGTARILIKANGDIEINPGPGQEIKARSKSGTADSLAKNQALTLLQDAIDGVTPLGGDTGSAIVAAVLALPDPAGTTILKGE